MQTKICSGCNLDLPLSDFHKCRRNRDGLHRQCKTCRCTAMRLMRLNNPELRERHNARVKAYRAVHPEVAAAGKKRERQKYPHRQIERTRKYRARHPEKASEFRTNRRARKLALPASFTAEDWVRCLEWWECRCAYCGQTQGLLHGFKLTADHFIPVSMPQCPGTVPSNMIPACGACNSSKINREPMEWLRWKFGTRKASQIAKRIREYFSYIEADSSHH